MRDLFGNEHPEPPENPAPAIRLSLLVHAAERAALESGRPLSQERAALYDASEPADWWSPEDEEPIPYQITKG
jgi:hypothetical protein